MKEQFLQGDGGLDGYFPKGTETAKGYDQPDPKEFFHFYRHGRSPAYCKGLTGLIFECLAEAAVQVLEDLACVLPTLRTCTTNLINSRRLVMRIAYYEQNSDMSFFAAPHEDINFITLLPKATTPGLAVLRTDGIWESVQPEDQQCIVLSGDMLAEASQGKIQATRHAVTALARERLSLSFFANPNDDIILSPRWVAGDFLAHRLREIGIYA
jgi:isopenicillin N synthase-like dioxygenase